jgi:hypothetical protein
MRSQGKLITGLMFVLSLSTKAQMSGVYNVPGNFPTLAAAISSLNSVGVNGPTTVNIAAGYTETAPATGFFLSATGTSVNPITFQKLGSGSNPILYAYSGGTAVPTSTLQDGVFRLLGSDYITIDGVDITDGNIANPATMEFGYGLFVTSITNGCQNNLIKNCKIKLNRVNAYASTWPCANGSRGIEAVAATYTAHTSILSPNSFAGTNSNNSFYNNTIDNCYAGISLQGHNASNFTLACVNNDVGGNSLATGNNILNFGGTPSASCEAIGIIARHQWNVNISNNYINNNDGNGFIHAHTLSGIVLDNSHLANATVNNNTLTLQKNVPASVTSNFGGIMNYCGFTSGSTATVEISNNVIKDCIQTNTNTFGSCDFFGIYNNTSVGYLNITNNKFINNKMGTYNGGLSYIYKYGTIPQVTTIKNNEFTKAIYTHSNCSIFTKCIDCSGSSNNNINTGTLSVEGNTLHALTNTTQVNGWLHFIYTNTATKEKRFVSNIMDSISYLSLGRVYGIQSTAGTQTCIVTDNRFTNIAKPVTGNVLIGIEISNTTTLANVTNVSNNYIGNASCTGTTALTGISVSTGSTQLMSVCNNTVTAISNASATNAGYEGIFVGGGAAGSIVSGNLVKGGSGFGGGGMSISNSFPLELSVFSNTVCNLYGTEGVGGIGISSAYQLNFYKNRVFDLESTNNIGNATVGGITISNLNGVANIYNNLIGDLRCPSCIGTEVIYGIKFTGFNPNTIFNVFYNTIYLNATSTGALFSTTGIWPVTMSTNSTLATHVIRNNIILNRSVPTGNGINQAIHRYMFTLENYDVASNHNLLYPGNTGTSCSTFYANNTNLAGSMPFITPREVNSFEEDPTFVSTNGNHPFFLMPSNTIPTQIESGAIPIATIFDDYAGNIRNTATPDVGAWEGYYLMTDSVSPTINNLQVSSGYCNLSGITLTTNIIDPSGVPTNSLAPRCYFKINNNPYISVQGTLASGTNTNGIWSFGLNYAAVPGNTLSYFITAQDNASPFNIGAMPTTSFAAVNVNSVTTFPTSPFTLTIIGVLNGTYSVGTTGNFTTLTQAADAYNTWCMTGPVTFLLTDANYSINETFPVTFTRTPYASTTNSLLIRPANGVSAVITGSFNSVAVLKFCNAKCIDVDGINTAGTNLKTVNTNTGNSSVLWLASTNTISTAGNKRIGIRNVYLQGGNNQLSTNNGIVAGMDMSWPLTGSGKDNDSVAVSHNTIVNVYYGITAGGTSSLAGGIDNWIIKDNIIGPPISGTNIIGGTGISIAAANTFSVSNNLIQHIEASNINSFGLSINGACKDLVISNNTLTALSSSATTFGPNSMTGIYLAGNVNNILINANYISNVSNTSPSGYYGVRGITLYGNNSSNSNIAVQNNMISDVYSKAGNTIPLMPIGICIDSGPGYEINNNSVHLATNFSGFIGSCASAAMAISSAGINVKIRNNIFSNFYDNTNSNNDISYAIYSLINTSAMTIDYNNYMVGGGASTLILGYNNPSNLYTLANIQTGFGGNLNSQNVSPVFTATNDLHLVTSSNPLLNNMAFPLSNITSDFDNQPRSSTTPDIGADEFFSFACSGANSTLTSPTSFSVCAGQTLQLSATSGSGNGLVYQWKVASTSNGPYSNVIGGTGANTPSYTTTQLNAGTYYFVMETTCIPASVTAVSNEATVIVNPVPTVTISSSSSACLSGSFVLNVSSDIATQFNWNGPLTYTSSVQNPTLINVQFSNAGIYTVVVQQAGCVNTGTTFLNVVNPTVAVSNTGPSCAGYTLQLNSTSANSYTWQGPNAFNSNLQNPLIAPATLSSSGVYAVIVSIGSCTTSATTSLSVVASPTAIAANSGSVCAGQSLSLAGSGGSSYSWLGPNSYTSSVQNPTIINAQVNASGVYTLQVSGAQFCSSSAITAVTIVALPVVVISPPANGICVGSSTTLTASGATTYTWSTSSNSPQIVVSPTTVSVYTVQATNSQGCVSSTSITITINPLPTIGVQTSNTLICVGWPSTLTAGGANTYTWSNNVIGNPIIVSPTVNTTYTVNGKDINGCENFAIITQSVDLCAGISGHTKVNDQWNIYPNPNQGKMMVISDVQLEGAVLEIFDNLGILVLRSEIKGREFDLNLGEIAKGIYYIKISSVSGTNYKKIIIQ